MEFGKEGVKPIVPQGKRDIRIINIIGSMTAILFFFNQDRIFFLCSPGCPGVHYVDQAVQELSEICLPLPCWE